MFYSEAILSRRGPLGRVWLAAHMERKLSKTQTLQTDIEQSVDAIMGQEVEVMALRLSGQLLLGVVRIYSRKAKYLLDDCNEALLKIKMAFRPGIVDMTEDQLAVNKNAITLQAGGLDLDLLLPDVNWDVDFEDRPLQPQGYHHQAHVEDITLRTADDFERFDINDPFDIGPSDGIGSQDFHDVDLGLNWGDDAPRRSSEVPEAQEDDENMSLDGSVGVGRDAGLHRESIASHMIRRDSEMDIDLLSDKTPLRELSEHRDPDMDFEGMDLGELGIGFDAPLDIPSMPPLEGEQTPGQTRSPSRGSSPLSEPPATPPPDELDIEVSVAEAAQPRKKLREKRQIIDAVTELAEDSGSRAGRGPPLPATNTSNIVTEHGFLPRSSMVMRLLEIREDPISHFLPVRTTSGGSVFCAAPPGLTPELAELFMRPFSVLNSNNKRKGVGSEDVPRKKPRSEQVLFEEVEEPRRGMSIPLESDIRHMSAEPQLGLDIPDQPAPIDEFQLEVPNISLVTGEVDADVRARSKSLAPSERSRLTTPALDADLVEGQESYIDVTCPIATFDVRPSSQGSEADSDVRDEGKGYSKNTIKALSIIRRELQPSVGTTQEKVMSFRNMSQKASRRAAAAFFFELLVLGTKDCIGVSQELPFANIEVRARDKLWKQQGHLESISSRISSPTAL
ncbi:hypothetical protein AX16_005251 [Volvariella volvacea WC 439]|nr:hypothetical protein AX16_005251 [Volvariella volvacea WC 439]